MRLACPTKHFVYCLLVFSLNFPTNVELQSSDERQAGKEGKFAPVGIRFENCLFAQGYSLHNHYSTYYVQILLLLQSLLSLSYSIFLKTQCMLF